jgi:hypothetical protein
MLKLSADVPLPLHPVFASPGRHENNREARIVRLRRGHPAIRHILDILVFCFLASSFLFYCRTPQFV